jgi:hypothetical protein
MILVLTNCIHACWAMNLICKNITLSTLYKTITYLQRQDSRCCYFSDGFDIISYYRYFQLDLGQVQSNYIRHWRKAQYFYTWPKSHNFFFIFLTSGNSKIKLKKSPYNQKLRAGQTLLIKNKNISDSSEPVSLIIYMPCGSVVSKKNFE